MDENRKIAFAEAYDIIQHSSKSIKEKISPEFINILRRNIENLYVSNIDYTKSLDQQNIQHETKIILGIVYRDYLCSPGKRKELILKEQEILNEIELKQKEKYAVENIFKNTKYTSQPEVIDNNASYNQNNKIIKYEKIKWYKNLFNLIKKLFKRK